MTNVYNTGTVSVPSNSNIVTGIDTYFQSVGNISEGDLFTLDGKAFFEIYQIDTDNQLRIKGRLDGQPYSGQPVSNAEYSIIQSFAEAPIAQVAQNVVLLQQKWHQREEEMTGWFSSENNFYQITNQHGEKVLVITPTGLTKLVDGTIDIGDGSGLTELIWDNIDDKPETATRWPSFEEVTGNINVLLQDFAKRWPAFSEVTGQLAIEQLPDNIDTDNKRTQALSPRIRHEQSISQRLVDYPTLKTTEDTPSGSPNNRREIRVDEVRKLVHVALPKEWLTIPNALQTRRFMVMPSNRYLRLNAPYTGDIEMRVCPMGNGGSGLPGNPSLTNHQWHTINATVSNLQTIGDGFVGAIDYIVMGNRWETLDTEKSHFESLNAYYTRDNDASVSSPFRLFSLRADGYWYSEDMTPSNPHTLGNSWVQDGNNFTVTEATSSGDALRFFSDGFDTYEFELILVVDHISGRLAITDENSDPNIVYYAGTARYITNDRIFFKRGGSSVTAGFTVESTRMRMPHYG